jgi:hypothetical protein
VTLTFWNSPVTEPMVPTDCAEKSIVLPTTAPAPPEPWGRGRRGIGFTGGAQGTSTSAVLGGLASKHPAFGVRTLAMLWRHSSRLGVVGVADDEDSSAAPAVAPVGELDEQPPARPRVVQENNNRREMVLGVVMGESVSTPAAPNDDL